MRLGNECNSKHRVKVASTGGYYRTQFSAGSVEERCHVVDVATEEQTLSAASPLIRQNRASSLAALSEGVTAGWKSQLHERRS